MPQKGKRKSHADIASTLVVARWKRTCKSQAAKKKYQQGKRKEWIDYLETMESLSYGLHNNKGKFLIFGENKML